MIGRDPAEIRTRQIPNMPVPVTALSKVWVCGRSLAGIMGSNSAGDMDVRLLCVVRWKSLRRADHQSRGVLPNVVRLIERDHESSTMRRTWPTRAVVPW